jgi:hypothetical protein
MNNDDTYSIHKYSDRDLFNILDLVNPTDRELEAKIISQIRKYSEDKTSVGGQLTKFFEDIYDHFFQTDEEEDDVMESFENYNEDGGETEGGVIIEGLENKGDTAIPKLEGVQVKPDSDKKAPDSEGNKKDPSPVVQKDYPKGKLNPILKETCKRVLHLDSQYRDTKVYPKSTDYTINLSDTLFDVVQIRLHSIQVPYTWYTIGNEYGANFFLLKAISPGINNGNHNYKFEIPVGIYNANDLIAAVNKSIADVSNANPDVIFGTTGVVLNNTTDKTTFTIDINKLFYETSYYVNFPTWSNPFGTDTERSLTIPGFLGFLNTTYIPYSIYSNVDQSKKKSSGIDLNARFYLYDSTIPELQNNKFTVINYIDVSNISPIDPSNISPIDPSNISPIDASNISIIDISNSGLDPSNTIIKNSMVITIPRASGFYTRQGLIDILNIELKSNPLIDASQSSITIETYVNTDEFGKTTAYPEFKLSVKLKTETTAINEPNLKQVFIFPKELNSPYPIWIGSESCFFLDPSNTKLNDIYSIYSNTSESIQYSNGFDLNATFHLYGATSPVLQNNTFTILNYVDPTNTGYNSSSAVKDTIIITLPYTSGFYTRQGLINIVNAELKSNPQLDAEASSIIIKNTTYTDASGITTTYPQFMLSIKLNTKTTERELNLKQKIIFPNESINQYPIWTGEKSCFLLDASYTEVNDIYSTNAPMELKYVIQCNPYVLLKCNKPGYIEPENNYKIDISNSPISGYTKLDYINAVNKGFSNNGGFNDIQINVNISENTLRGVLYFNIVMDKFLPSGAHLTEIDYQFEFYDTTTYVLDESGNPITSWYQELGILNKTYKLRDASYNIPNSSYCEIYAEDIINDKQMTINSDNNTFSIKPQTNADGVYTDTGANDIIITFPDGVYTKAQLFSYILKQFQSSPITSNSTIGTFLDASGNLFTKLRLNINKSYTSQDYALVFYDPVAATSCSSNLSNNKSATTTTWDIITGWIMGYHSYPEYDLSITSPNINNYITLNAYTFDPSTNIVKLTADTVINTVLFNQFYVILDDYTQNHLNDGVVTVTRADKDIALPSYASRANFRCDPLTNQTGLSFNSSTNPGMFLTQKQLFAASEILNNAKPNISSTSKPPYVKDMFALIPMKLGGLSPGQSFAEYGGTLQDNNRIYFGPVNLRRLTVRLISDRGNLIDLNGANWSFSIICDYLYTTTLR